MNHVVSSAIVAGGLMIGMLALLEAGRRIGARRRAQDTEGARAGLGVVDGALFALLGLLIAFTFSGAASRFDARRDLIVQEANDIGTAWLRLDLLATGAQPEMRELFRRYLDTRLAVYEKLPDMTAAREALALAATLQRRIWKEAVAAARDPGAQHANVVLLPALNAMFDTATTRTLAGKAHPPAIVFVMLGVLALVNSLLAGYGMAASKTRPWVHILGFAVIMTLTVYVILDLEYPRLGLIKVNAMDQVLIDLRRSME